APLGRILRIAVPEPRALIVPAALSALSQGVGLMRGVSFVSIVNTARGQPPRYLRAFGTERAPGFLLRPPRSLVIATAHCFVGLARRRSWHALGQSTTLTLRNRMYGHVLAQDLAVFDATSTAALTQTIDRDCEKVGRFVAKAGDTIVDKGLVLIVAASSLFAAAPTLLALL